MREMPSNGDGGGVCLLHRNWRSKGQVSRSGCVMHNHAPGV